MFIQIHTLTGYSGVLLNRDDAGMAKRIVYGGAMRTRVSSQSVKRKIRLATGYYALSDISNLGISVRSRETFRRLIAEPLIDDGLDADAVIGSIMQLMDRIYKPSKKALQDRAKLEKQIKDGDASPLDLLDRGEINVLSAAEIEYIKSLVRQCVTSDDGWQSSVEVMVKNKAFVDNLRAVGSNMSIDVAMYGRMVTGDALATVDAAVHVAHAITVHGQDTETDFFTAVDDLVTGENDAGSGHMGETELTTPLLYGYYVIDVDQLCKNLAGLDNAREVSAEMAKRLVHLVAEHVVGAKKGSTAPYATADLLMVEIGTAQPRSLAEAFRKPVKSTLAEAIDALDVYIAGKERMYGQRVDRAVASIVDTPDALGQTMTVDDLGEMVATAINGG